MKRTKDLFNEVRDHFAELAEGLDMGTVEEMDIYREISLFEKEVAGFKTHIEGYAIDEASKYTKPELLELGFEYRKGSRTYDFKEVPQVAKLKAELHEAQEASKQAIKEPVFLNGEQVKAPLVKYKKDCLIVKKAK